MSLPFTSFFFFFFFTLFLSSSHSALVTPITKDHSTHLYTITFYLNTPPQPTNLLLHLGSSVTWLDCTHHFTPSTFHSLPCNSSLCLSLDPHACYNCFNPPRSGCSNNSCALSPENPITHHSVLAQSLVDSLGLPNGLNPGQLTIVSDFVFSCSDPSLLHGLPKKVTGLAGLGRSNLSLPAQVSTALSSPHVFALCVSGSPSSPGVAFFNTRGPYYFSSQIDLSNSLIYTPLIINPVGSTVITYRHPSDEYFINVTSIKVNGKVVMVNDTLLTVNQNGIGGTKISTVDPYTVLETSIYKAFSEAFSSESAALNLTVTDAVQPFSVCYSAGDVLSARVGPAVPTVDLVMQSDDVFWRIFGANSMVRIARSDADVWCLGFVDGGANVRTSVVIGGHQLEDNLLQFDLGLQKLGFSSSLLLRNTACANFTTIVLK